MSLGKSTDKAASVNDTLFTISVDSEFALLNARAAYPSRMVVNSGKSSHHSPFNPFTLKHDK